MKMVQNEELEKLRKQYNPDGSDLRKAQNRMLEILKFIDQICEENHITYWLDSGTLLGAARHKGFIPWDDDTDICMPLNDMQKFKDIMLKQYKGNKYILHCHETDKMYMNGWIVLRETDSEYIQDNNLHNIRKYKGLQVDIFPVEENTIGFFHFLCSGYQSLLINRLLLTKKRLLYMIAQVFYILLYHIIIPFFRIFKKKNLFYRMAYGCTFKSKRYLSTIYPLSEIEFEGCYFKAPNNVDKYLTHLYKNWRDIPDGNRIITHNVKFIFLN